VVITPRIIPIILTSTATTITIARTTATRRLTSTGTLKLVHLFPRRRIDGESNLGRSMGRGGLDDVDVGVGSTRVVGVEVKGGHVVVSKDRDARQPGLLVHLSQKRTGTGETGADEVGARFDEGVDHDVDALVGQVWLEVDGPEADHADYGCD